MPPIRYAIQQASEVMVVNPTLPDEKSFITGNIHTAPAMIIIIPNMLLPFSESSPAAVTFAFFTSKYARTLITAADIISSTFSTVLNASQPLAYRSEGYSVQDISCMILITVRTTAETAPARTAFLSERKPFIITPFNCS